MSAHTDSTTRLDQAARTAHRASDPRTQYASRANPTTIPDRRGGTGHPAAGLRTRLRLNVHHGLVRLGALPVHPDIDRGSVAARVLGPKSSSAMPAVAVERPSSGRRVCHCGGELMLRLCGPGMSSEGGTAESIEPSPFASIRSFGEFRKLRNIAKTTVNGASRCWGRSCCVSATCSGRIPPWVTKHGP